MKPMFLPAVEQNPQPGAYRDAIESIRARVAAEDSGQFYDGGCDDEAIYCAITVCALFNFYTLWIDAAGVHALSDEAHRQGGKRTAAHGYVRHSQPGAK